MEGLIEKAQYHSVPIGNLANVMQLIQEMDIQYMKLLRKEGVVSWYGEGGQGDDWRAIVPSDYIPSEVKRVGMYTTYCVEVDVGFMALNAILASDDLKNVDKDAGRIMDIDNTGVLSIL